MIQNTKKLWHEFFSPRATIPVTDIKEISDEVWDWIYEQNKEGQYVRLPIALNVIRMYSRKLRFQGIKNSTEIAAQFVYQNCQEPKVAIPRPPPKASQMKG
jgi:hypothetical protein